MILNISQLIAALCVVESANCPNAVGDGGRAVGILQQHPIFVEDVNRILGREIYCLEDRRDPAKAKAMAYTWFSHYARMYKSRTQVEPTMEIMARMYNGGWVGYWRNHHATDNYWIKVERQLGVRRDPHPQAR